jgi:hypothetical protein
LPSQARAELEGDPDQTVLRVLELRAYAAAKAQWDKAAAQNQVPTGPLAELMMEIDVDLWRARRRRRG